MVASMYRLRNRLSLRAKIKALWSFFQITSKLDKVYEVRAPLPHSLTSPLTSPLTILPPRYLSLVTLLPSPSPRQVPMPSTVANFFKSLPFISIDVDMIGPLECYGVSGFRHELASKP